jgi:hypothetical protein
LAAISCIENNFFSGSLPVLDKSLKFGIPRMFTAVLRRWVARACTVLCCNLQSKLTNSSRVSSKSFQKISETPENMARLLSPPSPHHPHTTPSPPPFAHTTPFINASYAALKKRKRPLFYHPHRTRNCQPPLLPLLTSSITLHQSGVVSFLYFSVPP